MFFFVCLFLNFLFVFKLFVCLFLFIYLSSLDLLTYTFFTFTYLFSASFRTIIEFKSTSIFSKRPEPELTGLIKRYFLSVQYFEGSALNHNDLRRVQVRTKFTLEKYTSVLLVRR